MYIKAATPSESDTQKEQICNNKKRELFVKISESWFKIDFRRVVLLFSTFKNKGYRGIERGQHTV